MGVREVKCRGFVDWVTVFDSQHTLCGLPKPEQPPYLQGGCWVIWMLVWPLDGRSKGSVVLKLCLLRSEKSLRLKWTLAPCLLHILIDFSVPISGVSHALCCSKAFLIPQDHRRGLILQPSLPFSWQSVLYSSVKASWEKTCFTSKVVWLKVLARFIWLSMGDLGRI